jgi:CRISPR-associated endonuclease/helicase Cas3
VAAWAAGLTLPPAMRGPAGDKLLRRGRIVPLDLPAGGWWVLVGRDADATTEGEEGSFTGGAVALDLHLRGVEALARDFAKACGLPPELVDALARAGRLHDLGKADPRFQALLHGGDPVATARALARGRPAGAPELAGLLAKSAQGPGDRAARERAAARSGYPRGARHELLSVALVQAAPGLLDGAADPELVLHLVASHHGHCRPFAPPVDDPAPREVGLRWQGVAAAASSGHGLAALGSGVAERFWALTRRYGPHGLAALEAILRLADHRRSEIEQQGDPA